VSRQRPHRIARGTFDGAVLVTSDDPAITRRAVAQLPRLVAAMRDVIARHDRAANEEEPGFRCGCADCAALEAALAHAGLPRAEPRAGVATALAKERAGIMRKRRRS
jgi:hypothetical protein